MTHLLAALGPAFLFLADAAGDPGWVLASKVIGGGALVSAIASFFAVGFWVKKVHPQVIEAIEKWYAETAQREERSKEMKAVIDNETKRVDGLIRQEINSQVSTLQTALVKAINEMKTDLAKDTEELKSSMKAREEHDAEFRQDVMNRLGRIEGKLSAASLSKDSSPGFAAAPRPKDR